MGLERPRFLFRVADISIHRFPEAPTTIITPMSS
jgi:hypothetical protein